MEFDATFLIALISFIIFVFIMNAIFYKPVLQILQKRNNYVEDNFTNAKILKEQTKEKEDYHAKELDLIRQNARNTLNSALQRLNTDKLKAVSAYKTELSYEVSDKKENLKQSALDAKEVLDKSVEDISNNISFILFGDMNNKSQIKEE